MTVARPRGRTSGAGAEPLPDPARFTLVCFHAHPDDEALLTAGTMARAAAEGHRVVLVVATRGEAGLTSGGTDPVDLGRRRTDELHRAAQAVGCARVVVWEHADSGSDGVHRPWTFAAGDPLALAVPLAQLLVQEQADVLTTYDPAGGYGHPDHVQVHHVGREAARLAGTAVVLEATVDRDALQRVLRFLQWVPGLPADFSPHRFDSAYVPRDALTHRVDVRAHTEAKRAAMAAHVSQARSDSGTRTLAVLLRLPRRLFRTALGREWFVEQGRVAAGPLLDDVFASVRG